LLPNLNYSKDYRKKTTTYLKQESAWRFGELCGICVFLFHAKAQRSQRPQKKPKTDIKLFSSWRGTFFKLEILPELFILLI
jgi:hypothetical protein